MTQNFNSTLNYMATTQEPLQYFVSSAVSFDFKLDSSNKIFRFKYKAPKEQDLYFNLIGTYIQDKNIDSLLESFSHEIYSFFAELKQLSSEEEFLFEKSLFQVKNVLLYLKGELRESDLDREQVICRCMKVDQKRFMAYFAETKGSKKELINLTNMTLTCGTCKDDFQKVFEILTGYSNFVMGKTVQEMDQHIKDTLVTFSDYTSLDIRNITLNYLEFDLNTIRLSVDLSNSDIKSESLNNSITNFLCAQLNTLIRVELTLI